jgi:hypothetical protein
MYNTLSIFKHGIRLTIHVHVHACFRVCNYIHVILTNEKQGMKINN